MIDDKMAADIRAIVDELGGPPIFGRPIRTPGDGGASGDDDRRSAAARPTSHVDTMVVAYVPGKQSVLFQSDLGPQTPDVYAQIVKLGFKPALVLGGHGGVTPWAEYVKAAAGK